MIDKIGEIIFWGSFIFPIIITLLSLIFFKHKFVKIRVLISILLSLSVFLFMTQCWTSIFWRDGLASGFESSNGYLSLLRSLNFNPVLIMLSIFFAVMGIAIAFMEYGNNVKNDL